MSVVQKSLFFSGNTQTEIDGIGLILALTYLLTYLLTYFSATLTRPPLGPARF
jgi:hypothetical protein